MSVFFLGKEISTYGRFQRSYSIGESLQSNTLIRCKAIILYQQVHRRILRTVTRVITCRTRRDNVIPPTNDFSRVHSQVFSISGTITIDCNSGTIAVTILSLDNFFLSSTIIVEKNNPATHPRNMGTKSNPKDPSHQGDRCSRTERVA